MADEKEEGWGNSPLKIIASPTQHIRMRPGMYLGGTHAGMQHHLVYAVLDNILENARAGRGDRFLVELDGNRVTILDNQPPFSLDKMGDGGVHQALDRALGELDRGLDRGLISEQQVRGSLVIVRALSETLRVTALYEGKYYTRSYRRGEPEHDWMFEVTPLPEGFTFSVSFEADSEIFDEVAFNRAGIEGRMEAMAATCTNLQGTIRSDDDIRAISMPGGMSDFLKVSFPKYGYHPTEPFQVVVRSEGLEFDLAIQWTHNPDDKSKFMSWANSIRTSSGTHILGVEEALREVGLDDVGHKIALSVFVPEPRYTQPTKSHLANPEIRGLVRDHVTVALRRLLEDTGFALTLQEWRTQSPRTS